MSNRWHSHKKSVLQVTVGSSESYRFPQYVLRPTEKSQLYIPQSAENTLYKPYERICQDLGEKKW